MTNVTMEQADAIIDAAMKKGAEAGCRPLTVAVLDSGGHLVSFKRATGAPFLRVQVAIAKAYCGLGVGFSNTRMLGELIDAFPTFAVILSGVTGGRLVHTPGGAIIRTADDTPIGAVGTTGDTEDNDELCTVAGIESAGFFVGTTWDHGHGDPNKKD